MPRRGDDEGFVEVTTLATRIPKPLHHAVRVHCITRGTTIADFVTTAIEGKLAKAGRRAGRRRVSG